MGLRKTTESAENGIIRSIVKFHGTQMLLENWRTLLTTFIDIFSSLINRSDRFHSATVDEKFSVTVAKMFV